MEEISSKDRLADVRYHEDPGKGAPEPQVKGEGLPSKCGNV